MTAGLVLVLGLLVSFTMPLRASAISLKQNSMIDDNTIKLSDVFYGLPEGSDKVLGPAPLPGRDMVLNARTLLRIALAMDLSWRPASTADHVVLSRAGTLIDHDAIKAAILNKMQEEGFSGKYSLLPSSEIPHIVLPADMPAEIEVSRLNVKPERNWFEATLAAPSAANPVQSFKISGTMQRLTEVPVLNEALGKNTIIGKHDIRMMEIPEHNLKPDMILNAENLLGMTPRRLIVAGQPIQAIDIEAPRIVSRGDQITMVFRNGPLLLTAQGKALEHGARGDVIRVVNTGSNTTLEAEVTNDKEVTVKDF